MKTEHAEAVIDLVTKISTAFDATMTEEERAARQKRQRDDTSAALVYPADRHEEAIEEFATLAAVDALETMTEEIHTVIEGRMQKLYGDCLAIYYSLHEIAEKDPDNDTYVHHMREMEAAHLLQYGRAIPPRA